MIMLIPLGIIQYRMHIQQKRSGKNKNNLISSANFFTDQPGQHQTPCNG